MSIEPIYCRASESGQTGKERENSVGLSWQKQTVKSHYLNTIKGSDDFITRHLNMNYDYYYIKGLFYDRNAITLAS